MKSIGDIAGGLGIGAHDIEARLTPEFSRQFGGHMEEIGGSLFFDAEAEEFLRLVFARGGAAGAAPGAGPDGAAPPGGAGPWDGPQPDGGGAGPWDGPPPVGDGAGPWGGPPPGGAMATRDAWEGDGQQEAAAALPPAAPPGPAAMLPAAPPVWRSIELPLLYQPEVLAQAVDQHRREIAAFLNQFDRAVDRLVAAFPPKPGPKGRGRAARGR